MKKTIFSLFLALIMIGVSLSVYAENVDKDIIILYENDVHCAVDGYAKLSAMKNELMESYDYVGVVSVGDFIQGGSLGVASKGEYIVNIMNFIGYNAVALGNHEFDYKLERLFELANMSDTTVVCSNFKRVKDGSLVFQPYTVVSYGDVDIAYIGITTPSTLLSSSPAQFLDENGEYAYSFEGNNLYEAVQTSIDMAEKDGAEFIVALSHLGTEDVIEQWSSQALIKNTSGLDIVLDAHSHSVIEGMIVEDKDGNEVTVTSTGTKFENIGKLTISDDEIKTELIPTESYEKTDEKITAYIAEINEEYQKLGNRKIGVSEVSLTTVDENGNRIIRNAETNLGDFCADAYRIITGADISFMNGGGIRADIGIGEVTFNDILGVFPWNNQVCVAEVTGQQIVDMLEFGVMKYPEEDGSFQHISGITFDFYSYLPSPVQIDENFAFVGIEGERRIQNVKVMDGLTGIYEPIDLEKIYTLASHNYLLLEQGGGATMFKNVKSVVETGVLDVELLENYITENLGGVIGKEYAYSQNRINVLTNNISVKINGKVLDLKEPPVLENDRVWMSMSELFEALNVPVEVKENTMLPVRAVSQGLGAEVNWNGETKTVEIII